MLFQKVFAVIDHHLGIWHKSQRARGEGDREEEEGVVDRKNEMKDREERKQMEPVRVRSERGKDGERLRGVDEVQRCKKDDGKYAFGAPPCASLSLPLILPLGHVNLKVLYWHE